MYKTSQKTEKEEHKTRSRTEGQVFRYCEHLQLFYDTRCIPALAEYVKDTLDVLSLYLLCNSDGFEGTSRSSKTESRLDFNYPFCLVMRVFTSDLTAFTHPESMSSSAHTPTSALFNSAYRLPQNL